MTSPWSAVLTSSPTMTFTPKRSRLALRVERAGDLVVVRDRDRAEALVAGGGQQHLDRRRAVRAVVGVHVQVDVMRRRLRSRARRSRPRPVVVAPGRQPGVDRLEVVGDLGPAAPRRLRRAGARAGRRRRRRGRAGRRASPRRGARRAGRRGRSQRVLVDLQPRRRRAPRPRRRRGAAGRARARAPSRGGDERRRPRPSSASTSSSPGSAKRTRPRTAARSGVEDDGPRAETTVASQGSVGVEPAQGAQEEAQGRALLLDVEQAHDAVVGAARAALRGRGGRREDVVAPREGALHEPSRRRVVGQRGRRGAPGRGAPASARPGRRRAARAARGSRRRSARASGAARRSTTLGAKGSWTWQTSSASCSKRASSVRATSIGIAGRARAAGRAGRAAAPRRRPGPGTPASSPPGGPEEAVPARADGPATLAHERRGRRGRDDRDAVPAAGELAGDRRDVPVGLVAGLPRVRRDLGDRQAPGAAHRRQHRPTNDERPASAGRSARRRWRRGR